MKAKESKIRTHLRLLGLSGRDLDEVTECAMRYSISQVLGWTSVSVEIDDYDANTPVRVHISGEDGEHIDRYDRNCGWI